MKGNGYDYRVSLPRPSGTSKNLPRACADVVDGQRWNHAQ